MGDITLYCSLYCCLLYLRGMWWCINYHVPFIMLLTPYDIARLADLSSDVWHVNALHKLSYVWCRVLLTLWTDRPVVRCIALSVVACDVACCWHCEQIIQSSDALLCLLSHVLRTFLHCLALNQSCTVLKCMFASQRSLVSKVCHSLMSIVSFVHNRLIC